jgi:hypothetical protein
VHCAPAQSSGHAALNVSCEHVSHITSDRSRYSRLQRAIRSANLPADPRHRRRAPLEPAPRPLAILLVIDANHEGRFDSAAVRWARRLAADVRNCSPKQFSGALESLRALPDETAQRSLRELTQPVVPPGTVRRRRRCGALSRAASAA